jgi:cyclophilin family peptidyl-prolyl cis-trans isomerase
MHKLLVLAGVCAVLSGCGGAHSASTASGGCLTVEMPITGNRNTAPPLHKLDLKKTYDVTMTTSCGDFTIRLDPAQSPNAAASFASLVQHLYFYTTIFHRVVHGVLIQGGDPTGSGTGGPGYSTVDPPPKNATYTRGVVAMAKTGAEAPGTAGSQFFIVVAPNAGLTPDYAIVGRVVKGLDVVDRISQLGNPDQTPSRIVELISASLKISS